MMEASSSSPATETMQHNLIVVESSSESEQEDTSEDNMDRNSRKRRRAVNHEARRRRQKVIDLTQVDELATDAQNEQPQGIRILPHILRTIGSLGFLPGEVSATASDIRTLLFNSRPFIRRLLASRSPSPSSQQARQIILDDDSTTTNGNAHANDEVEIIEVKSTTASVAGAQAMEASTNHNGGATNTDGILQLECSICLGQIKNITATICGHIFCLECIRTAIQTSKFCPLCKKKLTLRSIHPLYIS
jgi:hypothetical protein